MEDFDVLDASPGLSGVMLRGADRAVLASVDDEETAGLLSAFISVDTENPPGNESGLVRPLFELLRKAGIEVFLHEVASERENLEAWLGPKGGLTLLLNCHTDTMPAGIGWTTPPGGPDPSRGAGVWARSL